MKNSSPPKKFHAVCSEYLTSVCVYNNSYMRSAGTLDRMVMPPPPKKNSNLFDDNLVCILAWIYKKTKQSSLVLKTSLVTLFWYSHLMDHNQERNGWQQAHVLCSTHLSGLLIIINGRFIGSQWEVIRGF